MRGMVAGASRKPSYSVFYVFVRVFVVEHGPSHNLMFCVIREILLAKGFVIGESGSVVFDSL